jgi:hypothetical protein
MTLSDTALSHAARGWPFSPVRAGATVPAIPRECAGHGFLDATCDEWCSKPAEMALFRRLRSTA